MLLPPTSMVFMEEDTVEVRPTRRVEEMGDRWIEMTEDGPAIIDDDDDDDACICTTPLLRTELRAPMNKSLSENIFRTRKPLLVGSVL